MHFITVPKDIKTHAEQLQFMKLTVNFKYVLYTQEKRGIIQHQQHRCQEVMLLTAFLCSPAVSRTTSSSWVSNSLISPKPCSSIMNLATGEFQLLLVFKNIGKTSCDKEKDLYIFQKAGLIYFSWSTKISGFQKKMNVHEIISIPSLKPFKTILKESKN